MNFFTKLYFCIYQLLHKLTISLMTAKVNYSLFVVI